MNERVNRDQKLEEYIVQSLDTNLSHLLMITQACEPLLQL